MKEGQDGEESVRMNAVRLNTGWFVAAMSSLGVCGHAFAAISALLVLVRSSSVLGVQPASWRVAGNASIAHLPLFLAGHLLPAIGLGVYRSAAGGECYNACLSALRLGYRHIDTAQVGGPGGRVEATVRWSSRVTHTQREGRLVRRGSSCAEGWT